MQKINENIEQLKKNSIELMKNQDESNDKYEKKIEVLPTSIMVIKNNDIDAKKFFLAYLDAGYTDFPNPEKPGEYFRYEHALWKNGKRYTKENKEDYFK